MRSPRARRALVLLVAPALLLAACGSSSKPSAGGGSGSSNFQAGQGNAGVAQTVSSTDGAIGYVDFSDAKAANLKFASIKNSAGTFVAPSLAGAAAAVASATVADDLTYSPLNEPGKDAYPITSPTWILVYTTQTDAAKGAAIKAFLNFIYTDGQKLASSVDYAPLPKPLLKQALTQVRKIVVPAS